MKPSKTLAVFFIALFTLSLVTQACSSSKSTSAQQAHDYENKTEQK
jgi:ABC-type oligopeptide transport system substrate-binding subunit